jgi:hypothetical protein
MDCSLGFCPIKTVCGNFVHKKIIWFVNKLTINTMQSITQNKYYFLLSPKKKKPKKRFTQKKVCFFSFNEKKRHLF